MNKLRSGGVAMLLAFATLTSASGTSRAGEARTHDGFFLRLAPGIGTASAKIEEQGSTFEFSDGVSEGDVAVGGLIGRNLLLHGTLFGWIMSGPKAELSLSGVGSGSVDVSGSVYLSAVGGGLTYYVMPANLYFTGSIGMGRMVSELEDPFRGETENGLAFTLGLGKEWWVGDAWGLGVAGAFNYFSADDRNFVSDGNTWSGPSYAVRFSATFN